MDPDVQQAAEFHGHMCPGLAIGVRAARYGLREIGAHAQDEEVVALVETDMCAVDAIQSLLGCTFGKGNLIHKDYGKSAFTFYRRSDGKGVRLVTLPEAFGPRDPGDEEIGARVRSGQGSSEDRERFREIQARRSDEILARAEEGLFRAEPVSTRPPQPARIHRSLECEECHESTMETRTRRFGDRTLCIPCFERADLRV